MLWQNVATKTDSGALMPTINMSVLRGKADIPALCSSVRLDNVSFSLTAAQKPEV